MSVSEIFWAKSNFCDSWRNFRFLIPWLRVLLTISDNPEHFISASVLKYEYSELKLFPMRTLNGILKENKFSTILKLNFNKWNKVFINDKYISAINGIWVNTNKWRKINWMGPVWFNFRHSITAILCNSVSYSFNADTRNRISLFQSDFINSQREAKIYNTGMTRVFNYKRIVKWIPWL